MLTATPSVDRVLEERATDLLNHWLYFCPLPPDEHLWMSANDFGEIRLRGMVNAGYPLYELIQCLQDAPGVECVLNDVAVIYRGRAIQL